MSKPLMIHENGQERPASDEERMLYTALGADTGAKREARMQGIRQERTARLAASDWTQLPDAALTEAQRQAWADYRQALRDLPASVTPGQDVVWPVSPKI